MQALPNEAETLKAIQNLDLLVVIDTLPSEIAGYADVVLPEVTFLERYDELLTGWGRQGWLALRQPVMPAPADQKPGWWIAQAARRQARHPRVDAVQGHRGIPRLPRREGRHSFAKLKTEGVILAPKQPITVEEGLELAFDTPSGKVEFWSDQLEKKGFDPVPKYTPPRAGARRATSGSSPAARRCTPSAARRPTRCCTDMMRENEVWVNTATAGKLGLKNGEYVKLKNQDGVVSEPHPRQGDAAHPPGHRLHGVRLRPHATRC